MKWRSKPDPWYVTSIQILDDLKRHGFPVSGVAIQQKRTCLVVKVDFADYASIWVTVPVSHMHERIFFSAVRQTAVVEALQKGQPILDDLEIRRQAAAVFRKMGAAA